MRGTDSRRRGFTLAELSVSIISATLLVGMAAMAMRVSMQARNQRSDQSTTMMEGREALETIERLVTRAVEVTEWDAALNNPTLRDATGEPGDSYTVNVTGSQAQVGGNTTFNVGDVITHNGTGWGRGFTTNTTYTWDPTAPGPLNGTPGLFPAAPLGTSMRVTCTLAVPLPPWPTNGHPQTLAPPNGGWIPGDFIVKRRPGGGNGHGLNGNTPGGTNNTTNGLWGYGSWRADDNSPPLSDTAIDVTNRIGNVLAVSRAGSFDLGSGPLACAVGDLIVRTPSGWRKLGWQNSMRNFKAPAGTAETNISGIQFYADVDPDVPAGPSTDPDLNPRIAPPAQQRKLLEWVWIWWDGQMDADQTNAPFERRGPVKVAIFRSRPRGGGANNTHDTWSRGTHNFFRTVNAPNRSRKAYFTTAANFGTLQMRVQSIPRPTRGGQITWSKRVAVTGGVFLDRTGELASLGTNPWDEVAPGARFLGGPARFSQVPSFTFSKSIYLDNASAVSDSANRPFTFNPFVSGNANQIRNTAVSWQIDFASGIVKEEHVVQPR